MRIVAGHLGGRSLIAPRGTVTRPTSDRVREALFSSLGDVTGQAVLDPFAGSGALALEALSRGAVRAFASDRDQDAIRAIRRNAEMLDDPSVLTVVRADWHGALARHARRHAPFDLCFLDPPYRLLGDIAQELGRLLGPILTVDARIVVESGGGDEFPQLASLSVTRLSERHYGSTSVTIMQRVNEP